MNPKNLGDIDGVDMWPSLKLDEPSSRHELLVNIDPIDKYSALRQGDYKCVIGSGIPSDQWYGETGRNGNQYAEGISPDYDPESVISSKAGVTFAEEITADSQTQSSAMKLITTGEILALRSQAEVECNVKEEDKVNI